MTRPALVLALLVAACARPAPPPVASFRNPAVPISSIALFDAARLDGDWREVAGYGRGQTCQAGVGYMASYLPGRAHALTGRPSFAAGERCHSGAFRTGRLWAEGVDLWVLWVDADYRTLVLGRRPAGSRRS